MRVSPDFYMNRRKSEQISPWGKNIMVDVGRIKPVVAGDVSMGQIILFPIRLAAVMNDIGLPLTVSAVRDNADVLILSENYDITGLPLIDGADVCGQRNAVGAKEYVKIGNTPEINIGVTDGYMGVVVGVLQNVLIHHLAQGIARGPKCPPDDVGTYAEIVRRIAAFPIGRIIDRMIVCVLPGSQKKVCIVIIPVLIVIDTAFENIDAEIKVVIILSGMLQKRWEQ